VSEREPKCVLCAPETVEQVFCELIRKVGVKPERCRELMEKRREKKISYPEFLKELGLDGETFDQTLEKALDEAFKPKRRS